MHENLYGSPEYAACDPRAAHASWQAYLAALGMQSQAGVPQQVKRILIW